MIWKTRAHGYTKSIYKRALIKNYFFELKIFNFLTHSLSCGRKRTY